MSSTRTYDIEIELMRGGAVVSTLTGAFGQSLKETRLTALLGYLIAIHPDPFLHLFGFRGVPQRVYLEQRHDSGRSDILIETNLGSGVVEAKVDATDPMAQSKRYPGKWVALLTHRVPRASPSGREKYVTWTQIGDVLKGMTTSAVPRLRLLSADLLAYMRAHHMIRDQSSVEIYAREINEPVTLELFLKAQLYGCNYQPGSRLSEALYFAPHFGRSIMTEHPGVNMGISYIAKVEFVGHGVTWQDFRELMIDQRSGSWWNRHQPVLKELRQKWDWKGGQHRSFLLLGSPRLAFNPPVRKEALQLGKGWLSKRFYSFDDLYRAWGR